MGSRAVKLLGVGTALVVLATAAGTQGPVGLAQGQLLVRWLAQALTFSSTRQPMGWASSSKN